MFRHFLYHTHRLLREHSLHSCPQEVLSLFLKHNLVKAFNPNVGFALGPFLHFEAELEIVTPCMLDQHCWWGVVRKGVSQQNSSLRLLFECWSDYNPTWHLMYLYLLDGLAVVNMLCVL